MSKLEVALFPIPELVAFPGVTVPLHVFEPRYRQLIHECVGNERLVGVCHTRKTIKAAPQGQTTLDALNSNQATYAPQPVFSAGPCELIETLPDGRLFAEIHMSHRLKIAEEIQTLPYRIVTAEVIHDEDSVDERADELLAIQIRDQIHQLLHEQNPSMTDAFSRISTEPARLSFDLFQFLRFEPDVMQEILETRTATERLAMISEIIGLAK